MRKSFLTAASAAAMVISMSLTAFAGEWEADATGWRYIEKDGTYPVSQWVWIDNDNDGTAECYCFDENGYCFMAATTPDHYTVNENGAWTVDGVVQTKQVGIQEAESVSIVDLSQFFYTDLKNRDKLAEFCGWTPEQIQLEISLSGTSLNDLSLFCWDDKKKEQYPYYFDFKHINGGGFETELTRITPMQGVHGFIKGLDTNKKGYGISELEAIVKQSGAAIVSKTEETTQDEIWGFNSDGSFNMHTGEYENVYHNKLVFDYNGVRFTAYNASQWSPSLNSIYAEPIK